MKLVLIIDETRFYHPDFVADFLRTTPDEVVAVGLVTKVLPKNNIAAYIRKHWYYLRAWEMAKLAIQEKIATLKDLVAKKDRAGRFYSVRSVLETFRIKYFEIEYDINQRVYIDRIKAYAPDVIVSSNPLFFHHKILCLPSICCVNRHSALLPSYGGLWPVFQAFRHGEAQTGVSVHTMVREIDEGIVLAHKKILIERGMTIADLYVRCFAESSDVLIRALDKVRAGDFTPDAGATETSYFSFPTKSDWAEFRKRGGRFA